MKKINDTMLVDDYELKMGQTYFNAGVKDTEVVFDVFFRRNPFNGGYTISGGLDIEKNKLIEIIRYILCKSQKNENDLLIMKTFFYRTDKIASLFLSLNSEMGATVTVIRR